MTVNQDGVQLEESTAKPMEYMGVSQVAELLGMSREALLQALARDKRGELHPRFPPPDVVVWEGKGSTARRVMGWHPSRRGELLAWKAERPGRGWRGNAKWANRYGAVADR